MGLSEYKEAIKNLVDSTNDETLLKHWKHQLEWDLENINAVELSAGGVAPGGGRSCRI